MLKDCIQHGLTKEPATFLDKPFGLGFAPVMHDSEPDDGHCAISFGYGLSTIVTKYGHARTALLAQIANSGQGRSLSHQSYLHHCAALSWGATASGKLSVEFSGSPGRMRLSR